MPRPKSVRRWSELSLAALDDNAARVRETTSVADLRADAYGHGLTTVAERLDRHGFEAFLVSPDAEPLGVRTRTLTTSDDVPTSAAQLFGIDEGFRAVLRTGAEVLAVKDVPAGEGISYGYTHVTARDTRIALIGAGYAHGIVRRASNAAKVRVGGAQRTIVGVISMDQLTVDLDGVSAVEGDDAVFFGDPDRGEPSLREWAAATGIRALAITSRLSDGFERRIA